MIRDGKFNENNFIIIVLSYTYTRPVEFQKLNSHVRRTFVYYGQNKTLLMLMEYRPYTAMITNTATAEYDFYEIARCARNYAEILKAIPIII